MLKIEPGSLVVFFVTLFFIRIIYQRRLKGNGKRSRLYLTFPRVKWTFCNLFLIDDFIAVLKIKRDGLKLLDDLIAKYGRNFSGVFGGINFIMPSDPKILKAILNSSNTGHLNKLTYMYEIAFSDLLKNGLFVADVDLWSAHRKAISKAFTYSSFPTYLEFINDGANMFIKSAYNTIEETGGSVEDKIKELMEFYIMKTTTEMIFGKATSEISETERAEFQESFTRAKGYAVERLLHPELIIRPIWNLTKRKRELDRLLEIMKKFSFQLIDQHRVQEAINDAEEKRHKLDSKTDSTIPIEREERFETMVQQMIKAGHSNQEICDEVNTFLLGGHDAGVATFNFAMFHLAANPEHQQKCREEIDGVLDAKGDSDNKNLTLDDLTELKYLERCILESMRITPPIAGFVRRLDAPLEIDEMGVLDAGQCILIMPWGVHRDPEIYPNPTVFDPDRFLPENVKQRHSHSFIPFSMGPRNCIGWKIGLMELKVFIGLLLRNFEWSTPERLEDIKIDFDISIKPERPFNLKFKLRNN